jgi:hypothetical protein
MNAPPNSKAKREYWFTDIHETIWSALIYAETARLQAEVRDIGGVRYAMDRLIINVKLARAAMKEIEALDAATRDGRANA